VTEKIRSGDLVKGTARKRAQRLFDLTTNVSTLRGYFEQSLASGR